MQAVAFTGMIYLMADKTQKTPKGEEIPVPKREDFDAVLDAVAKPVKTRSRLASSIS